jgi:hypothetical protein
MSRREKDPSDEPWDASQVVAYRLQRAREMRDRTQAWAAERISRFTDTNWTAATLSLAESGSRSTKRLRSFTAKELVAFARTYDLPVYYFFIPPPGMDVGPSLPGAADAGWGYFSQLVFGHRDNLQEVREEVAASDVDLPEDVPHADRIEGRQSRTLVASPDEIFAALLHGLAAAPSRGGGLLNADPAAFRALADYLSDIQNLPTGKLLRDSDLLFGDGSDES